MPPHDEVMVDAVFRGKGYGGVASRLMASGMNVNALRTNNVLRKDEWKSLDETVVEISKQRLTGVNDLVSRGLVYNLGNGLGTTVLETENESDMSDASVNMDGTSRGTNDNVEYDIGYLPLPITHKNFQINLRKLEASRKLGQPLDTTQSGIAARKVAERVETMLFQGHSTYTYGGGTIYGYQDFPSRNTGSLNAAWTATAATAAGMLDDVLRMKQASISDYHYGPWILYVPTTYETALDEDYNTTSGVTIRERIKKIEGIADVKVADKISSGIILVELQPETVRMVIGLQPTTVEWEVEGGMVLHYKVMTIMVPQIRADQAGKCGICHFT